MGHVLLSFVLFCGYVSIVIERHPVRVVCHPVRVGVLKVHPFRDNMSGSPFSMLFGLNCPFVPMTITQGHSGTGVMGRCQRKELAHCRRMPSDPIGITLMMPVLLIFLWFLILIKVVCHGDVVFVAVEQVAIDIDGILISVAPWLSLQVSFVQQSAQHAVDVAARHVDAAMYPATVIGFLALGHIVYRDPLPELVEPQRAVHHEGIDNVFGGGEHPLGMALDQGDQPGAAPLGFGKVFKGRNILGHGETFYLVLGVDFMRPQGR